MANGWRHKIVKAGKEIALLLQGGLIKQEPGDVEPIDTSTTPAQLMCKEPSFVLGDEIWP